MLNLACVVVSQVCGGKPGVWYLLRSYVNQGEQGRILGKM